MSRQNVAGASSSPYKQHEPHRGSPVTVGPYTMFAGGKMYFDLSDLDGIDLAIPLIEHLPKGMFGYGGRVRHYPIPDFSGVPDDWSSFVSEVIREFESGIKVLAFCAGSHGRTGCLIASLIAVLETAEETPDPIEAARIRHCEEAVETYAQAQAVFKLRGADVPAKYRQLRGAPREEGR